MTRKFDFAFLQELIGQQENAKLEFKSNRGLLEKKNRSEFVKNTIAPEVSAFLNSDGGLIVIGVEDRNDVAVSLSPTGIPKDLLNRNILADQLNGFIQPSAANFHNRSFYCRRSSRAQFECVCRGS